MDENGQLNSVHKDNYHSNISADAINELSIGQLFNNSDEVSASKPHCNKQNIQGLYNTKINFKVPKQNEPPKIELHFTTNNTGTILQLDPKATKDVLSNDPSILSKAVTNNQIPSMPNILFTQKAEPGGTALDNQGTFIPPIINRPGSEQISKVGGISKNPDVCTVPTISFDVENDGKGNNVIGITFPNTNLSITGTQNQGWRKWLGPLKAAAIIILIVLTIYFYRDHL